MVSARAWWLIVGGAAVVTASFGAGFWLNRPAPDLVPDQKQAYALMPAITAYLDSSAYWPYLAGIVGSAAHDKPGRNMWLCGAGIEEVGHDGAGWRVGMDVACADYFRQDDLVYQGIHGDLGQAVVVLSSSAFQYRVESVEQEPGGDPAPGWVSQRFSAAAAAEINSGRAPVAALPGGDALRAFGCLATSLGYSGPSGPYWLCQPAQPQ